LLIRFIFFRLLPKESREEKELLEAGLPPRKLKMAGETASEELIAVHPLQPSPGVLDFGQAGAS
jgi:hypothetical protein